MEKQLLKRLSSLERKVVDLYYKVIKPTPKYKVFTALLSQEGPSQFQTLLSQNDPILEIGVTYEIIDDGGYGYDFTNVGAPNNKLGTKFIATGARPNSWGQNAMLEYNEGAPIAEVLENTIGNVFITYSAQGSYTIGKEDRFEARKTWYSLNHLDFAGTKYSASISMSNDNINVITYYGETGINTVLNKTPIEIRIYNL